MDIDYVAKLEKYDEFMSRYVEGDEKKKYDGKCLLFYSLTNNDLESRYKISKFLLEKGTDVTGLNEEGSNLLHILLSRVNHNIEQTTELCKILIDKGVDVNKIDKDGIVPLQHVINMVKYSDEELEPLYQVLFAQGNILVNHKNAWGKTPIELAETAPGKAGLLERMRKYE